jgi:hypothetical protein
MAVYRSGYTCQGRIALCRRRGVASVVVSHAHSSVNIRTAQVMTGLRSFSSSAGMRKVESSRE